MPRATAPRYRAPNDRDHRPAARLALAAAPLLGAGCDALFLEIMPAEGGVRNSATAAWRLATVHETIPGVVWHPETGRSPSDPVLWQGLVAEVGRARKGNRQLPVFVFSPTECWMG